MLSAQLGYACTKTQTWILIPLASEDLPSVERLGKQSLQHTQSDATLLCDTPPPHLSLIMLLLKTYSTHFNILTFPPSYSSFLPFMFLSTHRTPASLICFHWTPLASLQEGTKVLKCKDTWGTLLIGSSGLGFTVSQVPSFSNSELPCFSPAVESFTTTDRGTLWILKQSFSLFPAGSSSKHTKAKSSYLL